MVKDCECRSVTTDGRESTPSDPTMTAASAAVSGACGDDSDVNFADPSVLRNIAKVFLQAASAIDVQSEDKHQPDIAEEGGQNAGDGQVWGAGGADRGAFGRVPVGNRAVGGSLDGGSTMKVTNEPCCITLSSDDSDEAGANDSNPWLSSSGCQNLTAAPPSDMNAGLKNDLRASENPGYVSINACTFTRRLQGTPKLHKCLSRTNDPPYHSLRQFAYLGGGEPFYGTWCPGLMRQLQDQLGLDMPHLRWIQHALLKACVPLLEPLTNGCFDEDLRALLKPVLVNRLVGRTLMVSPKSEGAPTPPRRPEMSMYAYEVYSASSPRQFIKGVWDGFHVQEYQHATNPRKVDSPHSGRRGSDSAEYLREHVGLHAKPGPHREPTLAADGQKSRDRVLQISPTAKPATDGSDSKARREKKTRSSSGLRLKHDHESSRHTKSSKAKARPGTSSSDKPASLDYNSKKSLPKDRRKPKADRERAHSRTGADGNEKGTLIDSVSRIPSVVRKHSTSKRPHTASQSSDRDLSVCCETKSGEAIPVSAVTAKSVKRISDKSKKHSKTRSDAARKSSKSKSPSNSQEQSKKKSPSCQLDDDKTKPKLSVIDHLFSSASHLVKASTDARRILNMTDVSSFASASSSDEKSSSVHQKAAMMTLETCADEDVASRQKRVNECVNNGKCDDWMISDAAVYKASSTISGKPGIVPGTRKVALLTSKSHSICMPTPSPKRVNETVSIMAHSSDRRKTPPKRVIKMKNLSTAMIRAEETLSSAKAKDLVKTQSGEPVDKPSINHKRFYSLDAVHSPNSSTTTSVARSNPLKASDNLASTKPVSCKLQDSSGAVLSTSSLKKPTKKEGGLKRVLNMTEEVDYPTDISSSKIPTTGSPSGSGDCSGVKHEKKGSSVSGNVSREYGRTPSNRTNSDIITALASEIPDPPDVVEFVDQVFKSFEFQLDDGKDCSTLRFRRVPDVRVTVVAEISPVYSIERFGSRMRKAGIFLHSLMRAMKQFCKLSPLLHRAVEAWCMHLASCLGGWQGGQRRPLTLSGVVSFLRRRVAASNAAVDKPITKFLGTISDDRLVEAFERNCLRVAFLCLSLCGGKEGGDIVPSSFLQMFSSVSDMKLKSGGDYEKLADLGPGPGSDDDLSGAGAFSNMGPSGHGNQDGTLRHYPRPSQCSVRWSGDGKTANNSGGTAGKSSRAGARRRAYVTSSDDDYTSWGNATLSRGGEEEVSPYPHLSSWRNASPPPRPSSGFDADGKTQRTRFRQTNKEKRDEGIETKTRRSRRGSGSGEGTPRKGRSRPSDSPEPSRNSKKKRHLGRSKSSFSPYV